MHKNFSPIIKRLKQYKPDKVILFGSYAWGKPNKNSDIDLLVIKNTKQGYYQRIPKVRGYLNEFYFAFDILVLTPNEVKISLNSENFFIQDIINKGKILYEKS